MTQTTVFEAVGGQSFFDALVERFYARVEADPTLRPLYPTDLAPATRALALFLGQYWGGPASYSAEKGHPRLRMRHAPFVIAGRERDAWLSAMLAALDDSDAPPAAVRTMAEYFGTASTAMINHIGTNDAGTNDAGTNDAGTNDAGTNDAGTNDAGTNEAGG